MPATNYKEINFQIILILKVIKSQRTINKLYTINNNIKLNGTVFKIFSKYGKIELIYKGCENMPKCKIINIKFNNASIDSLNNVNGVDFIKNYPVNYILYNKSNLYVGETTNIVRRLKEHYKTKDESGFEKVNIITHEEFNQSATYNIETNLINYLLAEQRLNLTNKNQVRKSSVHDYYRKGHYNKNIFHEIWNKLKVNNFVKHDLSFLRNKDVFKISPYKELTEEQLEIQKIIIDFCIQNIENQKQNILFIEGEAGTGKSVLLMSTFKLIQDLTRENSSKLFGYHNNYVTVNHGEMHKTYQQIGRNVKSLRLNMFKKTTQLRMSANLNTLNWIESFLNRKITKLEKDPNYDLFFFDDVLKMLNKIIEKNNEVGLSRMVATFDWIHKKDGHDYYVEVNTYKRLWNRDYGKTPWAEVNNSIDEIGSIYTVQGFDLNYVGVIIGKSIKFDVKKDKIIIDTNEYKDVGAFAFPKSMNLNINEKNQIKEEIIINSLNVLLKRGVKGLYIYAVDKALRDKLITLQKKKIKTY